MNATALRPLGIGEILDTGLAIYRAKAATLIKLVIVVVAPGAMVALLSFGYDVFFSRRRRSRRAPV